MRVIAGTAKNKKLKAPPGQNTRPITGMIKEALFNVLASKVNEAIFLDLFAGSGSVGIEALSRGAKKVVFIDKSKKAVQVIKKNLVHCDFTQGFEVYRNDIFRALDLLAKRNLVFDIIFLDPPFTKPELFHQVMLSLDNKAGLLATDGLVIIRTSPNHGLAEEYNNLLKNRFNKYGESILHYYLKS